MARRRRQNRWLARREGKDYGPYNDDELKECIARREIDLRSEICAVSTGTWSTVGEHAELRDFYSGLSERWNREALEASVDAQERKMEVMDKVKSGTWKLVVLGLLVVVGLGSWVIYRIMHAEPTGIMSAIVIDEVATLPELAVEKSDRVEIAEVAATKVKRIKERETYNTSGVGAEGTGATPTTSLSFDPDGGGGGGPSLSSGQISRITSNASPKLVSCAMKTRNKGPAFSKTNVSFLIKSGRLGGMTLGRAALKNKAFVSCVRRVLRGISVPKFGGSERRVTIPIRFR